MSFYADEVEAVEFDTKTSLPTNVAENNSKPASTSNPNVKVIQSPETIPVSDSNKNIKTAGVQVNVKVLADNTSNGWTNSGWVVKKGQRIKVRNR